MAKQIRWSEKIRRGRKDAMLSQSELAAKLGTDVGTVSRWERGTMTPRPRHQRAILRILEG